MQESKRNSPNRLKAKILIKPDRVFVRTDNEVELDSFEPFLSSLLQRVFDHLASDAFASGCR